MKLLRKLGAVLLIIVFSATVLIVTRDSKADVAGKRPKSDFDSYEQIIRAYGGEKPADGYDLDFKFIKSIASLPKQKCDISAYADWTKTDDAGTVNEKGEHIYSYERDADLFGCNAHFNVGINEDKGKYVALYITLTNPEGATDNVYKTFKKLWMAMDEGVGVANSYFLDREEKDMETVVSVFNQGVMDRDIAAAWPKNAMAWMVMLDYRIVDGEQMLEVRVF